MNRFGNFTIVNYYYQKIVETNIMLVSLRNPCPLIFIKVYAAHNPYITITCWG